MQKVVKLLRSARFTILSVLMVMFFAIQAYSQDLSSKKVTLNLKGVTIKEAFATVQKQSGITFVYGDDIKKYASLKLTLDAKDISVRKAIELILKHTNLKFTPIDDQVVIDEKSISKSAGSPKAIHTISGGVTEAETSKALAGVSVKLKGSTRAVMTDNQGQYSIEVPDDNSTLVFAYIGYVSREIETKGRVVIQVSLAPSMQTLKEVTVTTALGIKREEKSLGYSVTRIDGEDISKTAPTNWLNGLAGKVPGLTITGAGAGPGGTVRVTLRGQNSIDLDKGQPLLVVDGVPINSEMSGNNGQSYGATGNTDAPIDYGNPASEINPDDIEGVTVLRGPSAAALYGSRAASGAILITTKSGGKKNQKLDISINSNLTFDHVLKWPDYQYEYGDGGVGKNAYYSFAASADGPATHSNGTWGPKFDGQEYFQYDPLTQTMGTTRTPWVADPNYVKGAFRTGVTATNTVSIGSNGPNSNVRLSFTDLRNDYILPNTGYNKNTISFSSNHKINKLQLSTKVNYYHKGSDNLPLSGYNSNTYMYGLMFTQPNFPRSWFENYWKPGQEDIAQNNRLTTTVDNPYFILYEQLNTMNNNRVFGNISANYQLNDHMNIQVRTGIDLDKSFRTSQRPYSSLRAATGMYREQSVFATERNSDFLYKYDQKLTKDFGMVLSFGGNNTENTVENNTITAERLSYPGLYTLANAKDRTLTVPVRYDKVVNSLYGLSQFSFRNYVFLDLTGRNDWSSTLPKANNSYFYSSASASVVLSDMFDLSAFKPLSFFKLRASVSQVGNDTDPYRTRLYYSVSGFGGSYENPASLPANDLKPEIITNREFGTDIRFLNNKLAFDITYYNSDSKNQILDVPNDPATGYQSRTFNAGLINNTGWELGVTVDPLSKTSQFKWQASLNWSINKSTIKALAPGVESIIMSTGPRGYVEAAVGGSIGDIYGTGYLRSPDGQIVNDASGYPIVDTETEKYIGSSVPKWKAGIQNRLSYKNWQLSFSFDGQYGGKVYSLTNAILAGGGKLKLTLPGRYDGLIGEGVQQNPDGTYRPNDVKADAAGYYTARYTRDNVEANTFDASFIKFRELNLQYRLSGALIKKIKFLKAASVGVYGHDLMLFTKFPAFDPEVGTMNGNRIEPGFETGQFPSTRSFGANLKLSF
jgi:TonB-linked SusC/RagA family outer membrane protein